MNPNIQFIGRWEEKNEGFHSYWGGAYAQLRFTGTSIKLNLGRSVNMICTIDDQPPVIYEEMKGLVNLSETPLTEGIHTIRIAARYQDDEVLIREILLDQGASILPWLKQKELIEFIGDSITAGNSTTHGALSAYAWLTGERLKIEHTSIAYSGITLVDGYRHPREGAPKDGMSEQYFKTRQPNHNPNPAWDFSRYSPSMLVINLGSNDHFLKVPPDKFAKTYLHFLEKLRETHPSADIVVLRTFGGFLVKPTEEAVQQRKEAGDQKLHYINTRGWLDKQDYFDGVHPTDSGNQKAADQLTPHLASILKGEPK